MDNHSELQQAVDQFFSHGFDHNAIAISTQKGQFSNRDAKAGHSDDRFGNEQFGVMTSLTQKPSTSRRAVFLSDREPTGVPVTSKTACIVDEIIVSRKTGV
ncbi:hypothetical protein [Spirosoma spitsbergense]|uniref:hypothetical protein n=1 Tax=Spirosoma spitsbergense TaxID=431554 RepID=UPI0012FB742C|nr:hypothetical protein [Spirosoma spitsbergense]